MDFELGMNIAGICLGLAYQIVADFEFFVKYVRLTHGVHQVNS